jgi:hypothetical protein
LRQNDDQDHEADSRPDPKQDQTDLEHSMPWRVALGITCG